MATADYDDFLSFLAKPVASAPLGAPESPTTAPATASDDSSYSDDSSDGDGFNEFKMFLKGPSPPPVKNFSSGTEAGGLFEGVETETAASTAASSDGRDGPTDGLSLSSGIDLSEPNLFDDAVAGAEREAEKRSSDSPVNVEATPAGPPPKEEQKQKSAVELDETVPTGAHGPESAAPGASTPLAEVSTKEIEKPAAHHSPSIEPWVSPLASRPNRRKPTPKPEPAPKPDFTLPVDAPAATVHFEKEEVRKTKQIEAARDMSRVKDPVKPLPIDYFTKQGEAMMEAKAKAARELAEAEMPIGIRYFTDKGNDEAAAKYAEHMALGEKDMPAATKHFKNLAENGGSGPAAAESEVMPAAIQHFTTEANIQREKKRQEIKELKENPPPMPDGQAYFTHRWLIERERVKAENEEMRKNPPPASAATEYFKIKEAERQVEIEKMMNEPAPAAIEFFTQQARMEEEKNRRAYEARNEAGYEAPVATKHFAEKEIEKTAEVEAARDRARNKDPTEPLPIDYFTKQGEAMMDIKAKSARELAEAEMPVGVAYFTALASEDKAGRLAEHKALSEQEMPVATRYFKRLSEEEDGKSKARGEAETMPAAIQHFTLMDRTEKEEKLKEIEELNENPPPMPDGQAYFTNKWLAERERKRAENEEMVKNPPPASAATEYFKIKEEERKVEIEKMMNEPAPAAIEFFTQQARQEQDEARRALEAANEGPYEPPAATKHFAELEEKKAQEIEDARKQVRLKMQQLSDRPAVDWAALTKQKPPVVHPY